MIALVTLVLVLAIAATAGLAVRWLAHRVTSRVRRWALSLTAGLFALLISAVYLVYKGLVLPAHDALIFQDRTSVSIDVALRPQHRLTQPDIEIEVAMPRAIPVHDDAAIDLLIRNSGDHLATGIYAAVLEASSQLEARTPDACVDQPSHPNAVTACQVRRGQMEMSQFRWFVRSANPGSYYITVKLPSQLAAFASSEQAGWLAGLRRNGDPLTQLVAGPATTPRPSPRPWSSPGSTNVREIPAPLSAQRPIFREQDLEIDLRSQQVTFPLRFETTLGVTGTTYERLTLLGALASGALGGGWFWQLLSWIKAHQRKPPGKEKRPPNQGMQSDAQEDARG
jgi:hypothetical protein